MKKGMSQESKRNLATGLSSAAGAVAGAAITEALTPDTVQAQEIEEPKPLKPQSAQTQQTTQAQSQQPAPQNQTGTQTQPETENIGMSNPEKPKEVETEVEVLGYERVTNEDGSQMDIAVIGVEGEEVAIVDVNLDGKADAIVRDLNHDGIIQDDEVEFIGKENLSMEPLKEAAGFNELYAQNDLPDYVNDADVDAFTV